MKLAEPTNYRPSAANCRPIRAGGPGPRIEPGKCDVSSRRLTDPSPPAETTSRRSISTGERCLEPVRGFKWQKP